MIGFVTVALALSLGQGDFMMFPVDPGSGKTYEITINDRGQEETLWGFIEDLDADVLDITEDAPWKDAPSSRHLRKNKVTHVEERAVSRTNRWRKQAALAGYVEYDGYFVPQVAAGESERAHQAYWDQLPIVPVDNAPSPSPSPSTAPNQVDEMPHPIQRWGLHAAMLLVAGALMFVVWRVMVVKD
jgi:hypothetical protein